MMNEDTKYAQKNRRSEMDAEWNEQRRLKFDVVKTLYQNGWSLEKIMKVLRPSMGMGPIRYFYNLIAEGEDLPE